MKNILFITPFDINKRDKSNAAAANRIDLICKGLNYNIKEYTYNFYPLFSEYKNIFKYIHLIYKYIRLYTVFLNKYDYIYVYDEIWFPYLYRIASLCKCKIIIERCEFPLELISAHSYSHVRKFRHNRFMSSLKYASIFITCSNALIDFYKIWLNKECHILNIPLIVDIDEFSMNNQVKYNSKAYISYCGNMGNNKDGVDILIQAFAKFQKIHNNYRLRLIGGAPLHEMEQLKLLVEKLGVKNAVDFLGYMPHQELVEELKQSSLLTLARPANKQAEGGMPSKLAEYLATGLPTLVTNVGEINYYVKDGIDCYLSIPNSISDFAERMDYAISHPQESSIIGERGKLTVKQFDYKNQTKQFASLL